VHVRIHALGEQGACFILRLPGHPSPLLRGA
jgi:hypothetical protein